MTEDQGYPHRIASETSNSYLLGITHSKNLGSISPLVRSKGLLNELPINTGSGLTNKTGGLPLVW